MQKQPLPVSFMNQMADVLKVMGHGFRLRIVEFLDLHGPTPAHVLLAALGGAQARFRSICRGFDSQVSSRPNAAARKSGSRSRHPPRRPFSTACVSGCRRTQKHPVRAVSRS